MKLQLTYFGAPTHNSGPCLVFSIVKGHVGLSNSPEMGQVHCKTGICTGASTRSGVWNDWQECPLPSTPWIVGIVVGNGFFTNAKTKKPQANQSLGVWHWRRGWDSNPRYLAVRLISSQVHSTTLPPLQKTGALVVNGVARYYNSSFSPSKTRRHPDRGAAQKARGCCHQPAGGSPAPPPWRGLRPGRSR